MLENLGLVKDLLAYWNATGLSSQILVETTCRPKYSDWLEGLSLCFPRPKGTKI